MFITIVPQCSCRRRRTAQGSLNKLEPRAFDVKFIGKMLEHINFKTHIGIDNKFGQGWNLFINFNVDSTNSFSN